MKKFLSTLITVILLFSLSFAFACDTSSNTNSESQNSSIIDSGSSSETTIKYLVVFLNEDGTVLQQSEVEEGFIPEYMGETPSKQSTVQYNFTFSGWDKPLNSVTSDVTYTATFTATINKYVVKFVNDDGSLLQSSEVAYGSLPNYLGETPLKAEDDNYTYIFAGWDKEIVAVTGDIIYTATFIAEEKSNASDDPYGSDIY